MADERPRRRRRAAALLMIAVSCVALVATSYAPVVSRLNASVNGGGEVTAATPRTSGRIVLQLTGEALPELVGPSGRVSGEVLFAAPTVSEGHVAMEVRPVGLDAAPVGEEGMAWPLDQLCAIEEPCEREFEVTLTWLDPRPGASVLVSFSASVEVVYEELRTLPVGAAAEWLTPAPFGAVAVEGAVAASTEGEQLVLDDDHPAAARHVELFASSAARAALLSAFIESNVTQARPTEVRVSIMPDDAEPGDEPVDPEVLDPFDPFVGCPGDGDCSTGVTVLFELAASEPGVVAVVDWSLHAAAIFADGDEVPAAAELTAAVDDFVNWGPEVATVTELATGSFDPRSSVTIEVIANAAALDQHALAGVRPQAIAILTVDGAPSIDLAIDGDPLVPMPGGGAYTHLHAAGESAVFYPLRHCRFDEECIGEIWLSTAGNTVPTPGAGEEPLMVEWSLDLVLPYPGGTPPEGANLRISIRR